MGWVFDEGIEIERKWGINHQAGRYDNLQNGVSWS